MCVCVCVCVCVALMKGVCVWVCGTNEGCVCGTNEGGNTPLTHNH